MRDDNLKIFLSYVRTDTEADTGRLVDTLKRELPNANLFIDVEDIEIGANWKRVIERSIENSVIVLCVMGPEWKLSPSIDIELTIAFKSNVPVVPILLRDADLIKLMDGIKSEIVELKDRNAISIRHKSWSQDVAPLIDLLKKILSNPLRARVIIDPPNPESLLKLYPNSLNAIGLLNYAQDLAECLDDKELFEKAKEAALNFDVELIEKWKYDSEMISYDGYYRNIRASEPNLIQIIEAAKKRLEIEMNIREIIKQRWNLDQYLKVAQYLDDNSLLSELTMLFENLREATDDYRHGGVSPYEAKKELDEAEDAARKRLNAEIPGITKRYPDRKWPAIQTNSSSNRANVQQKNNA